MHLPDHRQRIFPRTVKEGCIQNQNGPPGGKEQKVGHFCCVGAVQADASLAQHRCEKQGIVVEAAEENTVHSSASRCHPALVPRRRATGKLSAHHRHVFCLLPFRLSGYGQNRIKGHTRNRVVLGDMQGMQSGVMGWPTSTQVTPMHRLSVKDQRGMRL